MHRTGMEIVDRGDNELENWDHSDESESDDEFGSLLDENEDDADRGIGRYSELDRLEKVQKYLNYIAAMFILVFLGYTMASLFRGFFFERDIHSSRPLVTVNLDAGFTEVKPVSDLDQDFDLQEIRRIAVLGERNSGSVELAHALSRCFPHAEVTTSLSREGYWFQSEDVRKPMAQTIVIGVFLNVYDWIDLMIQNPLHAPMHDSLKWESFVTKPWTITRPKTDKALGHEYGNYCQHDFNYLEVIPCKVRSSKEGYPVYELKPDGLDDADFFQNILELRSEKIKNFVSIMYWNNVPHFIPVKLEDIMKSGNMDVLIQSIELRTGMVSSCIEPPEVSREDFLFMDFHLRSDLAYANYMSEHVDWNAERLIGYKMGERMHDAPELDAIDENESIPRVNTDESYSVFKTPVSSKAGPKIALLVSYPSSGASFTLELIKYVTNTTTATNDGSEYVDSNGYSVPLYSDVEGPFLWGSPFVVPSTYVLTKSHCGGHCRDCPPVEYIETVDTFMHKCLETTPAGKASLQYDEELVKKLVHVIRNPFDNIVSRFYYEYKSWMGEDKDHQFPFSLDMTGFHTYCKYHDSHFRENEQILYTPKLLSLSKNVPCHADFYRYVQWHNLVIEMVSTKFKITPLRIYYEDYGNGHLESSVEDMLNYLEIPLMGKMLSFDSRNRHAHFNGDQVNATIEYIKELASKETYDLLERYFPNNN